MPESIIVVAGLGRCGTSLMMEMLNTAGFPVYCDPGTDRYSYETANIARLPNDHSWLKQAVGKAIKVLDPHVYTLPHDYHYEVIFLTRDPHQQAKSQAKFVKKIAAPGTNILVRESVKTMAYQFSKIIPIDQKKAMYALSRLPNTRMKVMTFESIITQPLNAAYELGKFFANHPVLVDKEMDYQKVAGIVERRSTDCYDGFLEQKLWAKKPFFMGQSTPWK